jgi:small conductance mechanosensitive channel
MDITKIKAFFATLTLEKILPVLAVFVIGLLVVKLLLRLFDRVLTKSKMERTMFSVLRTVMRVLLYFLLMLVVAGSLGVDVSSLIAVLSVISLAVSLAVQNTLSNVVGGITLLATHPFRVGEFVEIGADSGTVEEISMSYTKILTPDGKRIYIPNSDASAARVTNYSVEGKRRIDLTITASYEDAIESVKQALLASAEGQPLLPDTQPRVLVSAYLDSSVEYVLQLWVSSEDYLDVKFSVMEKAKQSFDARGIRIPFPQMDVHLTK